MESRKLFPRRREFVATEDDDYQLKEQRREQEHAATLLNLQDLAHKFLIAPQFKVAGHFCISVHSARAKGLNAELFEPSEI
ncbi:hypothetical protein ACU8KH_02886 [Lachancea thermotolerans]